MEMWKDCRPFELDVKDGWHLHLGNSDKQIRIHVPAGHYHGMVGEGFEKKLSLPASPIFNSGQSTSKTTRIMANKAGHILA